MADAALDGAQLDGRGAHAAINPVARDSRAKRLYASEDRSLTMREAVGLLLRSWPFIRPHRRRVALKFTLALASLVFVLTLPWPLKIIIDNVINARPLSGLPRAILFPLVGEDRTALVAVVAGFLALTAILTGTVGDTPQSLDTDVGFGLDQAGGSNNDANDGWSLWSGLLGLLEVWVTLDLTQRLNQTVRTTVYDRFLRSPLRVYTDQKIGDAIFRVMYDSSTIAEVLYRGLLAPAMSVVMFVLAITVLTAQFSQPLIPVLAAIALPLIALCGALFGRVLRDQVQRTRERGSDALAAFEERIAQVQTIKAFGQEARETVAVDAVSWRSYASMMRLIAVVMVFALVLMPAVGLLVAIGFYRLMSEVIAGRITLGDVVLLATYGMMMGRPMAELGMTWFYLQGPISGLRRIHSVLEALPAPDLDGSGKQLEDAVRLIEVRDLALAYDSADRVLDGVSFSLAAGELAAIAGPSGAGKTTLVHAIPRFIEPLAGMILINGADSRALALEAIRRRVAFVFQNEALFSMSIADNLRYGAPDASDAAMRAAAVMTGAAEFIEQMPDGYITMLGRRGARLSVGQKQRLAIARALLRDPDVLILDEPMAPLDPSSEAALMLTLRRLAATRIVLIVAHRAQTLAACDRIHFVADGSLVASGTHTELLRNCPAYDAYLAMTGSEMRA